MSSDDLHAPTNAGPPQPDAGPPADKSPTFEAPGAGASLGDAPVAVPFGDSEAGAFAPSTPADDRPELVVGAAFAGGVVTALILRRLGR